MQASDTGRSIEDRLQPWIDQAEYLILLILTFMVWTAGWVNLVVFESFDPVILGRYSLPVFVLLIVYTIGLGVWLWLIVSLSALARFKRIIAFFQRTPLAFFMVLLVFVAIVASMFVIALWTTLPLVEISALVVMVEFIGLVLFSKQQGDQPKQGWRRIAIGLLAAFILIELILQALAFVGVLPLQNTRGMYRAYGRVYQNVEGHANGITNQFGWYYPDFRLEDETRRVLLLGDTTVQALQIAKSDHMGVQLDTLTGDAVEVMAMGHPGYGAGLYLDTALYDFIWGNVAPDEMIVFIQPANDLQVVTEPASERPYFILNDDGRAVVHPDDATFLHVFEHVVFAGHEPVNPVDTIITHSFILTAIGDVIAQIAPPPPPYELQAPPSTFIREVVPQYSVTPHTATRSDAEPFGRASFIFDTNPDDRAENAHAILDGQLRIFINFMQARDITVKLVTVPYFPEAFYEQATDEWDGQFGDYDLLLPERRVRQFAEENGVSFLSLGDYLQATTPVDELRALFFNNGTGHLTEAGHALVAETLHACFYSESTVAGCVKTP